MQVFISKSKIQFESKSTNGSLCQNNYICLVIATNLHILLQMKIKLIAILFFAATFALNAQDTVRIIHANYTTVFDKTLKYPVYVEWWDTRAKVNCSDPLPRKNQFQPDPELPFDTNLKSDYYKSGYDRGHMCPAADNKCLGALGLKECFYFSNMAPQVHSLNGGTWEKVERMTRDLSVQFDSVHVWAGSVGVNGRIGSVTVPLKCWKVIHVLRTGEWYSYIMLNEKEQNSIDPLKVSKHEVEKLSGFRFKL